MINSKSLYGLLGYPLGHSFSRAFFNDKFSREGIDAEYVNFELPDVAALPELIAAHPTLRGLNVTIPHKQAVIPFLDELSDEARAIGAVNVIRIGPSPRSPRGGESCISHGMDANGKEVPPPTGGVREGPHLTGFNSDVIGFRDSLRPLLQAHHRRALVLGTGGASKAVCHALDSLGIEWRYVSRNGGTSAVSGLGGFSAEKSPLPYSAITPSLLTDYTLIINCTPLGMSPKIDTCPDIPYDALTPRHLLYDLVYNPEETLFLRRGREHGATTKNGLEMLHLQALASWRFWNDL